MWDAGGGKTNASRWTFRPGCNAVANATQAPALIVVGPASSFVITFVLLWSCRHNKIGGIRGLSSRSQPQQRDERLVRGGERAATRAVRGVRSSLPPSRSANCYCWPGF